LPLLNTLQPPVMGYELQITRKELYLDKEGLIITAQEWLAVVQDDPELVIAPEHKPYFAVWSGPGEYEIWIDYRADRGYLFSKNPTPEGIDKLIEIARLLNAKVQGEEGEIYDWQAA